MKNKIFVAGATGAQGTAIAQLFQAKGQQVVTLSSSQPSTQDPNAGLQIISGGFQDQATLAQALEGVKVAVYTFPMIFDLEKAISYTQNFIAAAEQAAVSLVIFNSSADLPEQATGFLAIDLKLKIQALLSASNLKVITLMPDIYLNNLVAPWSLPLIKEKGILPYPLPAQQPTPWISLTDLAKFVVAASEHPELAGEILPIGGHVLSGEALAHLFSESLGKPVQYIPLTPDQFEEQLKPNFGALVAKEISNIYRHAAATKHSIQQKSFKRSAERLGVTLQPLEDWVKLWTAPKVPS